MRQLVLVLLLLPTTLPTAEARQDPASSGDQTSLSTFLNRDGSLRTPAYFSARLNAERWRVSTASDGSPRFTQGADPADAAWDDRFCLVSPNSVVNAIAVNGTDVYIGGAFTQIGSDTVYSLIKWNGRNWSILDSSMDGQIYALAVNGNDLYAGGWFTTINGVTVNHIAKWDGSSWSALGTGTDNIVFAIGVQGSNVYAGGAFFNAGGTSASYIAKWDGTSWSALGAGFNGQVAAIAMQDTVVYAGGFFTQSGPDTLDYVARWDGSSWSPLSLGLNGGVEALAINGSDIYAGGQFTGYRHRIIVTGVVIVLAAHYVARWNGGWSALGGGTNAIVNALAVSDTNLFVGGQFDSAGGSPSKNVAMWNGSSWTPLTSGVRGGTSWVSALGMAGTVLYAGGNFVAAGDDSVVNIAQWNGSGWSPLGLGLNGEPSALVSIGTDVYAGGNFTAAGGVVVNHIARWDGTGWSAVGGGVHGFISSLTASGTDLIAGGQFDSAGGVGVNNIARWDGTTWSALGQGVDNRVDALSSYGTDLYVGGFFENAGGAPAHHIARWDGFGWSTLGTGLPGNNYVQSLAAVPNGQGGTAAFVGGQFDSAGGIAANYIAEWTGGHWVALDSGMNWNVLVLVPSGNDLYAGGLFYFAGSKLVTHIAKWDGTAWSALGSGIGDYSVTAIALDGRDLYATGTFNAFGQSYPNDIARWDGSAWQPLGSGTGPGKGYGTPTSLAIIGNDLYVGGYLTRAGGKSSVHFGHWKIPAPVPFALRAGWNLISLPVIPANDSVSALFPGAASNAFAYETGGYQIRSTMSNGTGYWLKFGSPTADSVSGATVSTDTIAVTTGWNMIGSISSPVAVALIASIPPGMVTGSVFGYSSGYVATDSIRPGNGYWVKVNGNGSLILSSGTPAALTSRIRIVPTFELPPPPPGDELSAGLQFPRRFTLEQNYPNPFNPATSIAYDLPQRTRVSLKIYDVLGQVMKTLVDGVEDAGHRSVVWDAAEMPSGVYFYRLTAGNFEDTKKALILR